MKTELNDNVLDSVFGGTVIISRDAMIVGFTTLGQMCQLKNCTYRQVRDFVDDQIDEQKGKMNGGQFDQFIHDELQRMNWI